MPPTSKQTTFEENAFLVFVNPDEADDQYVEEELEGLCEAAGVGIAGSLRQRLDRPYSAAYLGSGKVVELAAHVADARADVVIIDAEITSIQARNLENTIGKPIVDRTQLILDIFARRARTREGQLQVELAQLRYLMPRLMSLYTKFERQKGGIGMRGPGETKLESDRRLVRDRIARLDKEIDEVKRHREHQRAARRKYPFPFATICGYTSAGKSTLMNRLAGTELLADAMPFATLDPTTRKIELPDGYSVFLTDTVGFIRNLPTHLVAAFRATLEEVTSADIILHVVDVSRDEWDVQRDAVLETLEKLKAHDKPTLTVFNKVDLAPDILDLEGTLSEFAPAVAVSSLTGQGYPEMLEAMKAMVQDFLGRVVALIPYDKSNLVDTCYQYGRVLVVDYRQEGIYVEAEVVQSMRNQLLPYAV
jgi:GTP-binding protein HflX